MGATRVLAIGLDAAERSIVLDLAAQGRMPVVRSLLEQGHHATLDAPAHVYVGAVWPTLFTGVPPGYHGRWAQQALRPGTYETEWCGARSAIEPFWGQLGRAGLRVAAIDVPLAPLVPTPNGVQLAEWRTHDQTGPVESWADGPNPFARLTAAPSDRCDDYQLTGRLVDLRNDLIASVERKTDLIEQLMLASDWDLLFAVYGESHCAGHQCWHLHDRTHPRHNAAEAELIGDPVVDVYTALDAAVGRLCDRRDQDTTVAVVLSHGMGPHYDGGHLLGEILRRIEEATLGPPPTFARLRETAERRVRHVRRNWHGAPQHHGDGDFGRALDGSRRFLRVPNATPVGCVRLNVVGREPRGRVDPESEYDALCTLLARELMALVDPADDQPLVRSVQRVEAIHEGPFAAQIGDLFVEWRRDRPISAAASPTIGVIRGDYTGVRTGDHHPGGLLIATGPAVDGTAFADGLEGSALAPMVSGWLGVALPDTTESTSVRL